MFIVYIKRTLDTRNYPVACTRLQLPYCSYDLWPTKPARRYCEYCASELGEYHAGQGYHGSLSEQIVQIKSHVTITYANKPDRSLPCNLFDRTIPHPQRCHPSLVPNPSMPRICRTSASDVLFHLCKPDMTGPLWSKVQAGPYHLEYTQLVKSLKAVHHA